MTSPAGVTDAKASLPHGAWGTLRPSRKRPKLGWCNQGLRSRLILVIVIDFRLLQLPLALPLFAKHYQHPRIECPIGTAISQQCPETPSKQPASGTRGRGVGSQAQPNSDCGRIWRTARPMKCKGAAVLRRIRPRLVDIQRCEFRLRILSITSRPALSNVAGC